MKIIYLLESSNASLILHNMIIPQLEQEKHNAEVIGMFFFFDNTYLLVPENPIGEKLLRISKKYKIFLMCCDMCCEQREITNQLYPGVEVGCFPDLYEKAKILGAEQVITL